MDNIYSQETLSCHQRSEDMEKEPQDRCLETEQQCPHLYNRIVIGLLEVLHVIFVCKKIYMRGTCIRSDSVG